MKSSSNISYVARSGGAPAARAAKSTHTHCDIRCADCLTELATLPDESVHFVATDPPYFLDGMDGGWDKAKLQKRVKPGVIGGLPAGMKFDKQQGARLRDFMRAVAGELLRVLKPGGFAAVFCQARLSYAVGAAFDAAGFEIRDMLAWKYEGQAKAFSQEHFVCKMKISAAEKKRILREIAGKKTPQLKPQFEPIVLAQKPRDGTFINNWLEHQTGMISPAQTIMGGGFPGTILEAPKPKKSGEFGHITVKPVVVMRQLIRLFSVQGQTVLDPFLGSGTTAVAALHERRKFVGFEIDADYVDAALRRIENAGHEKDLF